MPLKTSTPPPRDETPMDMVWAALKQPYMPPALIEMLLDRVEVRA